MLLWWGKIVSKFDGFIIGGKVVQVRFFTDERLGEGLCVSFGGKLARVFFIDILMLKDGNFVTCIRFLQKLLKSIQLIPLIQLII